MKFIINLIIIFFVATSYAGEKTEKKTVVITCATGELGQAIAKRLCLQYNLIITGRNKEKLFLLQKSLQENSPNKIYAQILDYENPTNVEQFIAHLKSVKTALYGLVLMTPRPAPINLLDEKDKWLKHFDTCFLTPIQFLKGFLENKEAESKIVVIGGISSVEVLPGYEASSILRRMFATEVKTLSHALGNQGVMINTLSPGIVLTDHHKEKIQKSADDAGISFEEQLALQVKNTPLQRYAEPKDIAGITSFLLSSDSNHITGINLICDGGKTVAF